MKIAVFSLKGLGDGLISLALANNFTLNDIPVDLYHNNLGEIKDFFPKINIKKIPKNYLPEILSNYDKIFVSYDSSDPYILNLIKAKKENSKKIFILNPCVSKNIGNQPFYEDSMFSPKVCMVDNIYNFCKKNLKLKKISKKIKLILPKSLVFKKYKRIIIHPSSAKLSKNWYIEKYFSLAKILKKLNFEVVFVVSENEKKDFYFIEKKGFSLKSFKNLKDLSFFIYESSFMIGNDSGIGHLSSLLGLNTITIFRNHRSAALWRPGWSLNKVIYPNKYILNLSFYRLRDKHWKKFISKRKIINSLNKII